MKWEANLKGLLYRPLKDFDALTVGKFNEYIPEFVNTKVWTELREYGHKFPQYEVDIDSYPKAIPLENILEAYQGPIIFMSMMAAYGKKDFQQGLQIIEKAKRTESARVVDARAHVDEPEIMQHECAYPSSGHLVEDCREIADDGHPCFGDKGGESDIARDCHPTLTIMSSTIHLLI